MESANARAKKFTYFIGIDVSRNKLDYAVLKDKQLVVHRETSNKPEAILAFVTELKTLTDFKISKAVFCMEQTGFYCNHLLNVLKKLKAYVAVENPVQIKNSLGLLRGKNDKIDAIRIAQYAQRNKTELKRWTPRRPIVVQLMNLIAIRNRLLGVSVALKTPLKEQLTFIKKGIQHESIQSCKRSLTAIEEDLFDINTSIESLINADDRLNRLKKLITSVPSIGPVTAIQIIICTNEFRDINNPKKFACYAGVAPFKRESGKMIGRAKVSHVANKKIKSLLHICAMGSLRYNKELIAYYERKTKTEGKPKMAVINAIRYKLILRVFACVNQDRCFVEDHIRANGITAGELVYASSLKTY
jgi:transposase